jgi:hypothetical protein
MTPLWLLCLARAFGPDKVYDRLWVGSNCRGAVLLCSCATSSNKPPGAGRQCEPVRVRVLVTCRWRVLHTPGEHHRQQQQDNREEEEILISACCLQHKQDVCMQLHS